MAPAPRDSLFSMRYGHSGEPGAMFPLWVFLLLAGIKLWLADGLLLFAIGHATHDDLLFVNLADSLLKLGWLGDYNNLTLAKGPAYPMWIAFTHLLGVPLLFAQQLLYAAACLAFALVLRHVIGNRWLVLLLYAVLLFNPGSFADGAMTRVHRDGIYPALVMLLLISAAGLYLLGAQTPWRRMGWAVSMGLVLSAFWLSRESNAWVLPSLAIMAALSFLRERRRLSVGGCARLLAVYAAPFVILGLTLTAVAAMNNARYGVFTVMDTNTKNFLSAYGALLRVKHGEWHPHVPCPQEVRERIYAQSPAFAELSGYLDGPRRPFRRNWRGSDSRDDIQGMWFLWALRGAVADAGHYKKAAEAELFYKRLANEVNAACDGGRLKCGGARATKLPAWHYRYASLITNSFVKAVRYLLEFKGIRVEASASKGPSAALELFKEITNEELFFQSRLRLSGWAFSPYGKLGLAVLDSRGEPAGQPIALLPSQDVYEYFRNRGEVFETAREARFDSIMPYPPGGHLLFFRGKDVLQEIPLDGSVRSISGDSIRAHFDILEELAPYQDSLRKLKSSVLRRLVVLYGTVFPVAFALSLVLYIIATVRSIMARSVTVLWVIASSLLTALALWLFTLSVADAMLFPAIDPLYLSPGYPLMLAFVIVVLSNRLRVSDYER